jgi:hypothetical protein
VVRPPYVPLVALSPPTPPPPLAACHNRAGRFSEAIEDYNLALSKDTSRGGAVGGAAGGIAAGFTGLARRSGGLRETAMDERLLNACCRTRRRCFWIPCSTVTRCSAGSCCTVVLRPSIDSLTRPLPLP